MSIADLQASQQPMPVQELIAKWQSVEHELTNQTPGLAHAMYELHKHLLEHEELVTLMSDDDIAKLHQAHERHKQFALVQKEEKAAKKPAKSKKLTDNDLANL